MRRQTSRVKGKLVNMKSAIYHDFSTERKLMLILGGYAFIPRNNKLKYILNIGLFFCAYGIISFLMLMAIITIVRVDEMDIIIEAVHTFGYLVIACLLPPVRMVANDHLIKALKMIREGIFEYQAKVPGDGEYTLKKSRVGQVRQITTLFIKISVVTVFCHIVLMPVTQLLAVKRDISKMLVNPYLPVPLYMPFDAKTLYGYAFAYFCMALFFILLYTSAACFVQTYMSCLLQIIAEFEILIYSLRNIEKRALVMYESTKGLSTDSPSALFNGSKEFRQCIYNCLRENFLHHQKILQFKAVVRTFLEGMNTIGTLFSSVLLAAALVSFLKNPGFNVVFIVSCAVTAGVYFIMCYLGELITNKSKDFLTALYFTPWYQCNQEFKVLLNIGITLAQNPIVLRTSFIDVPTSLETFASTVATGYKVLNVLWT